MSFKTVSIGVTGRIGSSNHLSEARPLVARIECLTYNFLRLQAYMPGISQYSGSRKKPGDNNRQFHFLSDAKISF